MTTLTFRQLLDAANEDKAMGPFVVLNDAERRADKLATPGTPEWNKAALDSIAETSAFWDSEKTQAWFAKQGYVIPEAE